MLDMDTSTDDVELYRSPADVLRRERDHLKARLKEERAELVRFEEMAQGVESEMAGLLERIRGDMRATERLLLKYRAAIRTVGR